MALDNQRIVQLGEQLRRTWQQPHPAFASGTDPRSSDNALLLLFYGSLAKAAGCGWQNAGRTLVDKTYLRILKERSGLDFQGLSVDELAGRLDGFIRRELIPRWALLGEPQGAAAQALAGQLLELASQALFDSPRAQASASHLLFYLCPQLPLLPWHAHGDEDWLGGLARLSQLPVLPRPQQFAGDAYQQALIRQLIEGSDWWRRRVLVAWQAEVDSAHCASVR